MLPMLLLPVANENANESAIELLESGLANGKTLGKALGNVVNVNANVANGIEGANVVKTEGSGTAIPTRQTPLAMFLNLHCEAKGLFDQSRGPTATPLLLGQRPTAVRFHPTCMAW